MLLTFIDLLLMPEYSNFMRKIHSSLSRIDVKRTLNSAIRLAEALVPLWQPPSNLQWQVWMSLEVLTLLALAFDQPRPLRAFWAL